MKSVYIWNDVDLFLKAQDSNFNKIIYDFLLKLKNNLDCYYISSESFINWSNNMLKGINKKSTITIGTRPKLIINKGTNLNLERSIGSDGKSKDIRFKGESEEKLENILNNGSQFYFFEDVLVGGNTIDFICKQIHFLFSNKPLPKITFYIFYANWFSLQKLQEKWQNINFTVGNLMNGVPIKESTLICIYDLLYGVMNGKPYIENIDLLEYFFGEKTYKLIGLIKRERRFLDGCY